MKAKRLEFDWGDVINHLQNRLKETEYEGDHMDFIYIDEAQDLSIKNMMLFKSICPDVREGIHVSG